jgi:hypothetical protein
MWSERLKWTKDGVSECGTVRKGVADQSCYEMGHYGSKWDGVGRRIGGSLEVAGKQVIDQVPEVDQAIIGKDQVAILEKARGRFPLLSKINKEFLIDGGVSGHGGLQEGDELGRREFLRHWRNRRIGK